MRCIRSTVLALALLTACGDSGPDPIDAAGTWVGSTANGSAITLTLTETGGTVTGTGTFTTPLQSFPLTATGTYVEPHLSLTLASEGFNSMNLATTVSATTMAGTLNGSGFLNAAITFQRQ